MNVQEAIIRAEAWYLQRYQAVAHGHVAVDAEGDELREDAWLCVDLVPEHAAAVIQVLLDLTGAEVAVLEEGRSCPRCATSQGARQKRWLWRW